MILNDLKLRQYFSKSGAIVGSASIDLTLDGMFKIQSKNQDILFPDNLPNDDKLWRRIDNSFVMPANSFCLAGSRRKSAIYTKRSCIWQHRIINRSGYIIDWPSDCSRYSGFI